MTFDRVSPNKTPSHDPWTGVNGRFWRHTIGRASNFIRIPINLGASILQAGKIFGKTLALPFTYSVVGIRWLATKKGYSGSMSLRGLAIDGIGFIRLLQNVAICFKNTIVAPSVKSTPLDKSLKGTWVILSGSLHNLNPIEYKISSIFNMTIKGKKS